MYCYLEMALLLHRTPKFTKRINETYNDTERSVHISTYPRDSKLKEAKEKFPVQIMILPENIKINYGILGTWFSF